MEPQAKAVEMSETSNHQQETGSECLNDPNFATICSFIEKFGELCQMGPVSFQDLQDMIENTNEVLPPLADLHMRLLRRVYKSVSANRWEKQLCKFAHTFSYSDGWELEQCGYKKTRIQTKLRVLKNLLESQFDFNTKFKGEVNKLEASALRLMPLGRDVEGHAYWYQVDPEANLRVYREDAEEETWDIVASSREEMDTLIGQLKRGEIRKLSSDDNDAANLEENGFDESPETRATPNGYHSEGEDTKEDIPAEGVTVAVNGFAEPGDSKVLLMDSEFHTEEPNSTDIMQVTKDHGDHAPKAEQIEAGEGLLKIELHSENGVEVELSKPEVHVNIIHPTSSVVPSDVSNNDIVEDIDKVELTDTHSLGIGDDEDEEPMDVSESQTANEESNAKMSETAEVEVLEEPDDMDVDMKAKNLIDEIKEDNVSTNATEDEPKPISEDLVKLEDASVVLVPQSEEKSAKEKLKEAEEPSGVKVATLEVKHAVAFSEIKQETTKTEGASLSVKEADLEVKVMLDKEEVPVKEEPSDVSITEISTAEQKQNPEILSDITPSATVPIVEKPDVEEQRQVATNLAVLEESKESEKVSNVADASIKDLRPTVEKPDDIIADTCATIEMQDSKDLIIPDTAIVEEDTKEPDFEAPAAPSATSVAIPDADRITPDEPLSVVSAATCEKDLTETLVAVIPEPSGGTTVAITTITETVTAEVVTTTPTSSEVLQSVASAAVSETPIIEGIIPDETAEAAADNEKVLESAAVQDQAKAQAPEEPMEVPDTAASDAKTEQLTKPALPALSPNSNEGTSTTAKESAVLIEDQKIIIADRVEPLSSSADPRSSSNDMDAAKIESPLTNEVVKEAEDGVKSENKSDEGSGNKNETEETANSGAGTSENSEQQAKAKTDMLPADTQTRATNISSADNPGPRKTEAVEPPIVKANAYVCGAVSSSDGGPVKTSPLNPEVRHEESTPSSSGNNSNTVVEVSEPKCVKGHAYVCGDSHAEPAKSLVDAVSAEVIPNDSSHTSSVPSATAEPKTAGAVNIDSQPVTTEKSPRLDSVPDPKETAASSETTENQKSPVPGPKAASSQASLGLKPKFGLVGYADSSDDEGIESPKELEVSDKTEGGTKRKLDVGESAIKPTEKIAKLDVTAENPIVGEAIEEPLMVISGQGEGKLNEGGNEDVGTEDSSQEAGHLPPAKARARGRPKKGPANGAAATSASPRGRKKSTDDTYKGGRGRDPPATEESSGPTRRSSRVAQIREKEEEQRRKLEEERLVQLKEAQVRKQQKQLEREQNKSPKKTPSKSQSANYIEYAPEDDSESQDDEDDDDEVSFSKKGKKGRGRKSKNGKPLKKGATPWMEGSSEDGSAEEEEEHYDEVEDEEEELVFNGSDHEFSPESDLDDDAEISPSRHARTARQKEEAVDKYSETNCNKCTKGDHPEWILLCDECDKGWHASCLNPQLWVIPEGQWFCPPCEHIMLIKKLDERLVDYEKIWQRRESEILEKQRLAYVNISLSNVLPEKEDVEDEEPEPEPRPRKTTSRKRRMVYSDDEEVGGFINDRSDRSESGDGSGSYESDDEPLYKLRARRATKAFNFKEYDDMIKSALKDSDAEEEAEFAEEHVNGTSEAAEVKEDEILEKPVVDESEAAPKPEAAPAEDETDDEELDEKEKNRRKLFKSGARKVKKRLNDLSATSEEDSDEDFKESEEEDEDEEENAAEEESDWSGGGDSDDSMAKTLKRRKQQNHHRKNYGRRETYDEGGSIRRSTRRNRGRSVKYDESDQEDDEGGSEKWKSDESGGSESFPSGTESEEDETWGKKKKKPAPPPKAGNFFAKLGAIGKSAKPKKKRRKSDADDVDRPWSRKIGNKDKKSPEEPQERKTRGRQINFKDILDSGESDDDGNIKPKRRRILSDSEDDYREDSPSSSRKLAEEIKAENKRIEAAELERLRKEKEAQLAEAAEAAKVAGKKSKPSQPKPAKPAAQSTIIPVLGHSIASMAESSIKTSKGSDSIVENMLGSSVAMAMSDPLSIMSAQVSGIPTAVPVPADQVSLTAALNPAYLPTVISTVTPPVSTGSVGSGSARVGKRKSATGSEVLAFPSSKKPGSSSPASSPPTSKPTGPPSGMPGLPPGMPGIPSELHRLAAPMYAGNPGLAPFHPAWVRGPYDGPTPGASMGKPPPGGFGPQQSPLRPTAYGQLPQGMRAPPPNPMAPFQHFGKDPGGAYKVPPQHQLPRGVLPPMVREPFLGHPAYPYGMLPPHPQSHPPHPSLFGHFEYRPPAPETFTKGEPILRQSMPPSTSSSVSSPIPATPITSKKDDAPAGQGDGEFGGLVSYFSSQHADDD